VEGSTLRGGLEKRQPRGARRLSLAFAPSLKTVAAPDLPPQKTQQTGKTTLLQLLGGKYMVGRKDITILGGAPFFDMDLTCSGRLAYLGTTWRRDVSFAGDVALQADVTAGKVIFGVEGACPKRRSELIRLLDVDLTQRLTTMSDGQRRRVQICMGLLKPYDALLMDEITVDMDVLGRHELLSFFEKESAKRGSTIVYATHIFDGLERWVTHVAYMEDGRLVKWGTRDEVLGAELGEKAAAGGAAAGAEAATPTKKKKLLQQQQKKKKLQQEEMQRPLPWEGWCSSAAQHAPLPTRPVPLKALFSQTMPLLLLF